MFQPMRILPAPPTVSNSDSSAVKVEVDPEENDDPYLLFESFKYVSPLQKWCRENLADVNQLKLLRNAEEFIEDMSPWDFTEKAIAFRELLVDAADDKTISGMAYLVFENAMGRFLYFEGYLALVEIICDMNFAEGNQFRSAWIDLCQKEFENDLEFRSKVEKINGELPQDISQIKKMHIEYNLAVESIILDLRLVRTIDIICKLYGSGTFSSQAMVSCVTMLVETENELYLPVLCLIMYRVGQKLEEQLGKYEESAVDGGSNKWKPESKFIKNTFEKLDKFRSGDKYSAYSKNVIRDILEYRENNWKSLDDLNDSETLSHYAEIKKELESFGLSVKDYMESLIEKDPVETADNELPVWTLTEIAAKLKGLENYFNAWFRDYQLTPETIKDMPTMLYAWIGGPDSIEYDEVGPDLEHFRYTFQILVSALIEAFVNFRGEDLALSLRNIMWIKKLRDYFLSRNNTLDAQDYFLGFQYLTNLLEIDLCLRLNIQDVKWMSRLLQKSNYESLRPKGKFIIELAKWTVSEENPGRQEESLQILRKMLELNPEYGALNYVLYTRLRLIRRESVGSMSAPSIEELNASVVSFKESAFTTYRDTCMTGMCQCLAEILRHRVIQREPDIPLDIGIHTFKDSNAVLQFIAKVARYGLRHPGISFEEFICYGKIFSSILPSELRNYKLARQCYESCLVIRPEHSKANHRMGLLQLTGFQNVKKAIEYFERAVKAEPNNFPAYIDLIQTGLSSIVDYGQKIDAAFTVMWNNEKMWTADERATLSFIQGCFYFLAGNHDSAFFKWEKIASYTSMNALSFDNLYRIKCRYCWPQSTTLTLYNIQEAIEHRLRSTNQLQKEQLILLLAKIERAKDYRSKGHGSSANVERSGARFDRRKGP